MKKNSKFLLIGLLVLSILISISAISATDNNTSINTIKSTDNTQDMLSTQTSNIIQKNNSIKSIKSENKNIKNENTDNKIKTQKVEVNNKINSETTYKNPKKDYTVNNYEELYNTIESIKHTSTNDEETVNLNEGTYTITNTIIWDLSKTLIINGNGKTIINGTQTNQFMQINGATSSVILNNIIIADCHAEKGGAIYNEGTLRTNNVSFINNTVPANGGAIYTTADSSLFIEKSTFDNNKQTEHISGNSKGYNGGALSVRGTLYINDSTFINNLASYTNTQTDSDGGNGGAIAFVVSTNDLTITNSRFDNNSARHGGAILIMNLNSDEGTRTIKNVTFTNNQGVYGTIVTYNTLTINNSTFKNNVMSGYGSGSRQASGGAIVINSNNDTASPKLIVNNTIFDKNEAAEGGVIDIATVSTSYKNATVTIHNSSFTNNKGNNGGVIYLEYGDVTIDNCVFDNNTAKLGGALYLKGNATINNSTFTNNNATSNGGAINVYNVNVLKREPYAININNSIFTGNVAKTNGGAITTQHLAVNNTTFTNNNAGAKGGAIHSSNTAKTMPVNINNSKFTQNTAGSNGGAVSLNSLTIVINTNFTDNKAMMGGALHATVSNVTITNSNFNNNKANSTIGGGAVYSSGNLNITNNNFTDNTATLKGGAIFITPNKNLTISDSKFDNNKAINETNYTYGGAIYTNARVNLTNTEFTNNNASYGGAIYFTRNDTSNITNSKFINNVAANRGGAIYNNASSTLDITNTIFDKNNHTNTTKANNNDYGGAAIFSEGGLHITSTNFTNNHANYTHGVENSDGGNGGAITHYNTIKDLIIKNSRFDNNSARHAGTILIYNGASDDGLRIIENTTFNGSVGVYGTIETYNSLNITSTVFSNNTMEDYGSGNRVGSGGAIVLNSYFTTQSIKLSIDNSTFENNTATEGGVIRAGSPVPTTFTAPTLEIKNSNFKNNHAYSTGGAISTYPADITITNTNFTNNKADNWGGAISTGISNLTISGSKFTNNSATKFGGAIYSVLDSTLKVNNATFTNNTQTQIEGANRNEYGGAAIFSNATLDINDTTFINNTANYTHNVSNSDGGNGGAIAFINSTNKLNINNSKFDANSARHGGAIIIMNGDSDEGIKTITNTTFTNSKGVYGTIETYNSLNVTNSSFDNNTMEDYGSGRRVGSGGAIVLNSMATNTKPVLTVKGTNFTNNKASLAGAIHIGGVSSTNGHPLLNVSNSTFKNNSVSSYGGAIYSQISDMLFENNYFAENKAAIGGAIMSYTGSTLSSKNDTFENNKATTHGGAIYGDNSEIQINSSKFVNNNASLGGAVLLGPNLVSSNIINSNFSNNNATYGGAILSYNNGQINNTEFSNNTANYGGAMYVNSGTPTIGNSSFKQNTANVGGALYNVGTLTLDTNNFVNNNGDNGETIYTTTALNTKDNTINLDDRTAFANQTTTISSPITDTSGTNNYVYEIYDPEGNLENTINAALIDNSRIVANYTFTDTGVYTVKLTYSGTVNNIEMKVTVSKSAINEITIDEIGLKHPLDSITISGIVNSESGIVAGENVIIYINGKQVTTVLTDSEGKYSYTATITTNDTTKDGFISLLPGRNNIDVSINEDDVYLKFNNSTNVIVSKLNTAITIDNVDNVIAGNDVTINGKLTDNEDNIIVDAEVTITVNGITYTITTDKDGKFSQVVPTTNAGNLNIIATYEGNERYMPTHSVSNINVAKRNTVLSIDGTYTSLIKDTFTVNGKLKTDDNTNINNAEIIVTIDGVNYTTYTNANGIFTINVIAPSKTGNYAINAVYNGNNSLISSNANSNVNVIRKTAITEITIDEIGSKHPLDSITISGTVSSENGIVAGENVIIYINGKQVTTVLTDSEGKYSYTATITTNDATKDGFISLLPGKNNIDVSVEENDNYLKFNNSTNVVVSKLNTIIDIDNVDNVIAGNDVTINGKLIDSENNVIANAEVTITVNGVTYTITTDENGKFSQVVPTTNAGNLNIIATYEGNERYNANHNINIINVAKRNTVLSIDGTYTSLIKDTFTVNGKLTTDDNTNINNAEIIVTIDGVNYTTYTNADGIFTINVIAPSKTGNYTINAVYNGNNSLTSSNANSNVNVIRKTAITEITIDEIGSKHPLDSITISGTVNSENGIVAGENVIIYINGKQVTTVLTDSEGKYSYTATITTNDTTKDGFISLLPGKNNIDVSVEENDLYLKANNTTEAIVSKLNTTIAIDNIDKVIIGDDVIVNGKLIDSENNVIANAKLTITVNGVTYTMTTDKDGKFNQVIPTTNAGNLNIITIYEGNERYMPTHSISDVNIAKRNTVLSINGTYTSLIKDTFTVNGKLTTDDNNNNISNAEIIVTIDGVNYTTYTNANGIFNVNVIAPSKTGNYTINVVYNGNNSLTSSNANSNVNVIRKTAITEITIDEIGLKHPLDSITISGIVNSENGIVAGENVIIYINGKQVATVLTDSEGKYSYTATITTNDTAKDGFISLLPGKNNIDVSVEENDLYLKANNTTEVIVSKLNTTIAIDNVDKVIIGDDVIINGKLTDSENNVIANAKLTITVNYVNYIVTTDENGIFTQVIPTTITGNLNIITTYTGSERYEASHNVDIINISKRNTVLSINNTETSLINDTFTVNGKLTTDDNNILDNAPILISINGMNYITHSDANGSFTLNVIAPNKNGNHTIKATYIGNDSFMSSTVNSHVNVKKLSTTTTVKDITTKIDNTVIFTANVVDEKGNTVLSGKVVFKLNGNTIGVVNIENGIASMEYKVINSPKDYKITAKYAESSAYLNSETTGVLHVIKRDASITLMNVSEPIVGDKINLVAIVSEDEGIANDGIVIFKINGVTLRNSDGGAVNATVINGIASTTYIIPSSFSAKNYTITAVYSNNKYNKVYTTINFTILKSNATTQLSPMTTVHGENTTLNISLYDQKGRQIIRDNKLAVKINGKTIMHGVYTNGSANIVVPTDSLRVGHYNLTIVFGGNNAYNTLRLNTILFITMPVVDESQNSSMKNETEIKA